MGNCVVPIIVDELWSCRVNLGLELWGGSQHEVGMDCLLVVAMNWVMGFNGEIVD